MADSYSSTRGPTDGRAKDSQTAAGLGDALSTHLLSSIFNRVSRKTPDARSCRARGGGTLGRLMPHPAQLRCALKHKLAAWGTARARVRMRACVRACVRGHCGLFVRMDIEFPITVGHLLTRVAGATSHCVARFAGACRGLPASDGAGAQ